MVWMGGGGSEEGTLHKGLGGGGGQAENVLAMLKLGKEGHKKIWDSFNTGA